MEPFEICLALGPLALYLLTLGFLNLRARPSVVAGWREFLGLGLALSGFVIVGPMRLFMPEHAAVHFGGLIWGLLVAFYALCFTLAILIARPRIVVYNARLEHVRPALLEVARRLDPAAAWAGNCLAMPELGTELFAEEFTAMRNVALVATGEAQTARNWRMLEVELRRAMQTVRTSRNPRALSLLVSGGLLLAAVIHQMSSDPQAVAQGLSDMLHF
jgi:hypothetical protein